MAESTLTPKNMRRDFSSRQDLIDYLRVRFPEAAQSDNHIASTRGGRQAAERALQRIDPAHYAARRNFINGPVTHLSPYLRHGVLTLSEVRKMALSKAMHPKKAAKLINELGWRDYFQRVYAVLGDEVWSDIEPYKTGFTAAEYSPNLTADVQQGETGLACIDAFVRELQTTGYLHNHARMWLAAYVIHWRRVHWRKGAAWFLHHLLDGDPASNNLSWQWVASTFSHKPYFFNRENLERYTDGVHCGGCPLAGRCDFEGEYPELEVKLFPNMKQVDNSAHMHSQRLPQSPARARLASVTSESPEPPTTMLSGDGSLKTILNPIVWLHGDCMNPASPALRAYPVAPAIWVWDDALLRRWRISLKRILFIYECLLELPATIRRGDIAVEVLRFAAQENADTVVTINSPSPRFTPVIKQIEAVIPTRCLVQDTFVPPDGDLDLRRFSRYWRKIQRQLL